MQKSVRSTFIKLTGYVEKSHDTKQAVYERIRKGKWLQGVHWVKKENRIWINEDAAQEWVRTGD